MLLPYFKTSASAKLQKYSLSVPCCKTSSNNSISILNIFIFFFTPLLSLKCRRFSSLCPEVMMYNNVQIHCICTHCGKIIHSLIHVIYHFWNCKKFTCSVLSLFLSFIDFRTLQYIESMKSGKFLHKH